MLPIPRPARAAALALAALVAATSLAPPACADEAALAEGSAAPDFTLKDSYGNDVSLASLLSKGPVVLYCYPKDSTPGCTREACAYRDRSGELATLGATIVGVSMDSVESHAKFRDAHKLTFPLLADVGGAVSRSYGAAGSKAKWSSRWTFVIDRQGRIAKAMPDVDPVAHIDEVLAVLKTLK